MLNGKGSSPTVSHLGADQDELKGPKNTNMSAQLESHHMVPTIMTESLLGVLSAWSFTAAVVLLYLDSVPMPTSQCLVAGATRERTVSGDNGRR